MRHNILIIEEIASSLNDIIISALSKEGFKPIICLDPLEVLARLEEIEPDLILLGEGLTVDSFEICCQLRKEVEVPILMIGSFPHATGWVKAVRSGADCYLIKTVSCLELVARTKAILRRYEWTSEERLLKDKKGRSNCEVW